MLNESKGAENHLRKSFCKFIAHTPTRRRDKSEKYLNHWNRVLPTSMVRHNAVRLFLQQMSNFSYIVNVFKWANPGLFLGFLSFLHDTHIKYILKKVLMVYLGLEPGAAGWKAKTYPLSYGSTPT